MQTHRIAAACALTIGTLTATLAPLTAQAAPYRVGGATFTLIPDSSDWAWDRSYMTGFRSALEDPANFGPTGTVNREIQTVDLSSVNAITLSGVDMFVGTWVSDTNGAPFANDVRDFFLNGGDLFLLQDDSAHDILGATLGISTTPSDGSDSNGSAPLFDGPFGVATNVKQHYLVGQLDPTAIAANGGHVGGVNGSGQVTSAYWAAGEYAPGAGSLFIIADIDMIATTTDCGDPLCGGGYAPLNDNGIYALNTFSFLQSTGGNPPRAPEPASVALLGAALAALAWQRRRQKTAAMAR